VSVYDVNIVRSLIINLDHYEPRAAMNLITKYCSSGTLMTCTNCL